MRRCRMLLPIVLATALLGQDQPKPTYEPIVTANNRFVIKLLKASFSSESPANLITGPAALSSGLSWLMNGASEPARTEIQSALELKGLYSDEINLQNLALTRAHPSRKGRRAKPVHYKPGEKEYDKWWDRYRSSPTRPRGYFRIVGLWTEQPTYFEPRMKMIGSEFYGAELLNFPRNWTAADLDRWIDSRTKEASKYMVIPARHYEVKKAKPPNQDFKFIDASLFNCDWAEEFAREMTTPAQFQVSEANTKSVAMMSRRDWMSYGESEQYQLVRLGYEERYSLYVLLPSKNMPLGQFIHAFDEDQIATFEKSLASRPGLLRMPRFDVAASQDATPVLKKLGINNVFESWNSLKPGFSAYGGKLFDVQVRSHVKLDEEGTKLINVTEMSGGVMGGIRGGTLQPEVPFEMVVDRPFLFYIKDDVTNEVLFLGTVVDP